MENINNEQIRQKVRERYAEVAKGCCSSANLNREPSCCGNSQDPLENRAIDGPQSGSSIIPQGRTWVLLRQSYGYGCRSWGDLLILHSAG
jgi:hypothetical protein